MIFWPETSNIWFKKIPFLQILKWYAPWVELVHIPRLPARIVDGDIVRPIIDWASLCFTDCQLRNQNAQVGQ
jgi:hypothetical protein